MGLCVKIRLDIPCPSEIQDFFGFLQVVIPDRESIADFEGIDRGQVYVKVPRPAATRPCPCGKIFQGIQRFIRSHLLFVSTSLSLASQQILCQHLLKACCQVALRARAMLPLMGALIRSSQKLLL